MSALTAMVRALLATACGMLLAVANGCDTGATGIEDCRQIEQARCRASKSCGLVDDVAACERFYRDQCLHGLPVEPPGSLALNACVKAITDAGGVCAAAGSGTTCGPGRLAVPDLDYACQVLTSPETVPPCGFLTPGFEAGTAGTGGTGGNGGDDGGETSAAGAGGVVDPSAGGSAGSAAP